MWNILTNPLHTVDFWTVNKASGYRGIFTVFFVVVKTHPIKFVTMYVKFNTVYQWLKRRTVGT